MISKIKNKAKELLLWSQKYTKTDMLYLARGSFWLTLGQGIQMASGLILAVAFANLLPKEVYGIYRYVLSVATIVGVFTLSSMGTVITRAVARGYDGALRVGFRAQMIWSIGIVIASGMASLYYYINDNTTLAISLLIVGAFVPFIKGFGLYKSYLTGKQLFRESVTLGIWRKPLPLIAIITTLFLTDNPVIILLAYYSSNAISLGFIYLIVVRRYPATPKPNSDPELINYGKHLSFMTALGNIASNMDKILIFHFLGAAPVAIYSLATVPIKHIQTLFNTTQTLALPRLSKRNLRELQQTLHHKIRVATLLMAIITVAYILAAPFLFKLLFPAYLDSVLLSQIIALTLLTLPRTLYSQALEAHKMKRELYILRISVPIVRISLLGIFLPLYGIWGAVYTLLGTQMYATVLTGFLFYRARGK